jgi:hypothetical protein
MLKSLSLAERQKVFGPLEYELDPEPGNPEHVNILGDWVKENIVIVSLPVLMMQKIQFNIKAADALQFWFEEMNQMRLLSKIVSFDGSFCPRLIRDGTTLSNHAFGVAIDLNAHWNQLGKEPAKLGDKGCVLEMVDVAAKHGFFWGGNYKNRKDGMHFEYSLKG